MFKKILYDNDCKAIGLIDSETNNFLPYFSDSFPFFKDEGYKYSPFLKKDNARINSYTGMLNRLNSLPNYLKGEKKFIFTKASCLIPSYKKEKYLEKCVLSVINQTVKYDEIIILAMTKKDICIAEKLKESFPELKIIHSEKKSIIDSRMFLAKIAKNDWITFLDADDEINNCFLEECIKKTPSCFVIPAFITYNYTSSYPTYAYNYDFFKKIYLCRNLGGLYYKNAFLEIGLDNNIKHFLEDTDFLIRAALSEYKSTFSDFAKYIYNNQTDYYDIDYFCNSSKNFLEDDSDIKYVLKKYIDKYPEVFEITSDMIYNYDFRIYKESLIFESPLNYINQINEMCQKSLYRESKREVSKNWIELGKDENTLFDYPYGFNADVVWEAFPSFYSLEDKFSCLFSPELTDIKDCWDKYGGLATFIYTINKYRCIFIFEHNINGKIEKINSKTVEESFKISNIDHVKYLNSQKDKLTIIPTDYCTKKCEYCETYSCNKKDYVNFEEMKIRLDKTLKKLGKKSEVTLIGGELGETDDELLEFLSKYFNKDYQIKIFTNGELLKNNKYKKYFPYADIVWHWVDYNNPIPDYVPLYASSIIVVTHELINDENKLKHFCDCIENSRIDIIFNFCRNNNKDLNCTNQDAEIFEKYMGKRFEYRFEKTYDINSCSECVCRSYHIATDTFSCPRNNKEFIINGEKCLACKTYMLFRK